MLLLHAYPIPPGGRSASKNAMSEKLLKFINGLSRKLQAMLKHKEYPSFEVSIKKTEARVACEEDFAEEKIAVSSYSKRTPGVKSATGKNTVSTTAPLDARAHL